MRSLLLVAFFCLVLPTVLQAQGTSKADVAAGYSLLFLPKGFTLIVDTTNPTAGPSQFRVSLSEDHQVLTGIWDQRGGGRLNAPDKFRKVPE